MAAPRQCSHDRLVEAVNQASARVGDQPNFTGLARLEAHGRSRRNIQAIAKSSLSIEGESRVGLREMIMTADLDRSVARIGNFERNRGSVLVQDDLAGCLEKSRPVSLGSHRPSRASGPQRIGL